MIHKTRQHNVPAKEKYTLRIVAEPLDGQADAKKIVYRSKARTCRELEDQWNKWYFTPGNMEKGWHYVAYQTPTRSVALDDTDLDLTI